MQDDTYFQVSPEVLSMRLEVGSRVCHHLNMQFPYGWEKTSKAKAKTKNLLPWMFIQVTSMVENKKALKQNSNQDETYVQQKHQLLTKPSVQWEQSLAVENITTKPCSFPPKCCSGHLFIAR